jgi:hypothetical protein
MHMSIHPSIHSSIYAPIHLSIIHWSTDPSIHPSIHISSCCSHLEHGASVKSFVSLQFLNPKTVGRPPWTENQPDARSLPIQSNTNTDIHASSRIRTHDPSVWGGENNACLWERGHCDRHTSHACIIIV